MLFTYKYINHDIEKLQGFLDFLFYDVWLVAEDDFDVEKLNGNPELKQIYEDFGNVDYDPATAKKGQKGKSEYYFNASIEEIFEEFAKINDDDFKLDLIDWYSNNNEVEKLCNDKSITPIDYKTLQGRYPSLKKAISNFCTNLYGNSSPFNLKVFGQLSDKLLPSHYHSFMEINTEGLCPFCGISKVDGNIVDTREAYDHYLPKSLYPFNSINFKNLAPMCDKCNSRNKGADDPIDFDNGRQLAFYPFSTNHPKIDISIELKTKDVKNLKHNEIDIEVKSLGYEEQIESWKRVFGIEKRYKELCCDKNEGLTWFNEVVDGFQNAKEMGVTDFDKWIAFKIKEAGSNELSSYGFLKKQFLTECKDKGILNAST
jgi:5-methylcytosine-specific restriction endonuclease McrA